MFDLVETLRDVPALIYSTVITGTALMGQNMLNNRRDDRRRVGDAFERQKDRDHQIDVLKRTHQDQLVRLEAQHGQERALAETAQDIALVERWRDEKKVAHSTLIAVMQDVLREFNESMGFFDQKNAGRAEHSYELSGSIKTRIASALAQVQMLASDEARAQADNFYSAVFEADLHIWMAWFMRDVPDEGSSTLHTARQKLVEAQRCADAYLNALRRDLGTQRS